LSRRGRIEPWRLFCDISKEGIFSKKGGFLEKGSRKNQIIFKNKKFTWRFGVFRAILEKNYVNGGNISKIAVHSRRFRYPNKIGLFSQSK